MLRQPLDEALIDLDLVEVEAVQIVHRRIAGAEIVKRDPHADVVQSVQGLLHALGILHEQRFGHLELEPLRQQVGGPERADDRLAHVAEAELGGGQIDRHLDALWPVGGIGARLAQRPLTDRHDEARLLRQRDEVRGRDEAACGMVPAQQRLELGDLVSLQIELGLVVELKLAVVQRCPQIALERVARLHLLVHRALEETRVPGSVGLCPRQRQVGILEQLIGIFAIAGADRDADVGTDHDLMVVDVEGRAENAVDLLCKRGTGGRRLLGHLQDYELVAADAGDHFHALEPSPKTLGNALQQRVANGRPQRVVDLLEAGKVDKDHDERAVLRAGALEARRHPLAQEHAIGQVRQRIVTRHVRHLRLDAPQLRDVLVRGHPPSMHHRLVHDGDDAAIGELLDLGAGYGLAGGFEALLQILVGIVAAEEALGDAALDDLAERRARRRKVFRQAVHLDVTVIADHEPLVLVEHAQSLRHVPQRRIEAPVLLDQVGLVPVELHERPFGPLPRPRRLLQVALGGLQRLGIIGGIGGTTEKLAGAVGGNAEKQHQRRQRDELLHLGPDQDMERVEIGAIVVRNRRDAVLDHGTANKEAPADHGRQARNHDRPRMEPKRAQGNEHEQENERGGLEAAAGRVVVGELVAPDQRQKDCDVDHVEDIERALRQILRFGEHPAQRRAQHEQA